MNRPSEIAAAEAVQLSRRSTTPNDLPLLIGGPVEPQRGWILTSQPPEGVEHRELGAGLYLSASPVLFAARSRRDRCRRRTLVLAGYAGWGPGQLDAELARVGVAHRARRARPRSSRFRPAASWEMAIRRLGADPHLLQPGHGVH